MKVIVKISEPLTTEVVESITKKAASLDTISISYMGISGSFEMLTLIQAMGITGEFEIDIDGNESDIEQAIKILQGFNLLKQVK